MLKKKKDLEYKRMDHWIHTYLQNISFAYKTCKYFQSITEVLFKIENTVIIIPFL